MELELKINNMMIEKKLMFRVEFFYDLTVSSSMDGFRRNGQHDERKSNYYPQVSFLVTCQQVTMNGVRRNGKHNRRIKLVIKPLKCVTTMRISLPWQH
jgi:hypothetical protein